MFKSLFAANPKVSVNQEKISQVLNRNVEEIFVKEHLENRLSSGKQLRVKLGIDPTGANLHLGHAVVLWKLREFQDMGHKIVFVVGDFTAKIGDPSDKLDKRPMLDSGAVKENISNFKKQVGKVVDLSKVEFVYNSQWLSKLSFDEICNLAESFSVQQMVNRRNFKERMEKGTEISLREFLYPLMQGYDSVAVESDIEIGGFDQLFNLKAGRTVQKHYGQKEQDILTTKMLTGTDGRKMSKSWGNAINILDGADEMFGKVMSLKDDLMTEYYELCSNVSDEELEKAKTRISSSENPRDIKFDLAMKIVALYHGEQVAKKARENFVEIFSEKKIPDDVQTLSVEKGTVLADVLVNSGIVKSKSEWRRLVSEGAVSAMTDSQVVSDPNFKVEQAETFKVGKRRFVKVEVN